MTYELTYLDGTAERVPENIFRSVFLARREKIIGYRKIIVAAGRWDALIEVQATGAIRRKFR